MCRICHNNSGAECDRDPPDELQTNYEFLCNGRVLTRPPVGVDDRRNFGAIQTPLNNDDRRVDQANFAGIWARLTPAPVPAAAKLIGGERPACPAAGSPALRSG
jgi:hypothetical protein